MKKTKALILYTSVGHGIKATAYNIFEQIEKSEEFEARIADIGTVEAGKFARSIQSVYTTLTNRFAPIWGILYTSRIVNFIMLPLRKFIASFKSKNTLELLREYQPPIVISVQAICTGIVAYLKSKGLYRGKLVAVFSDYHLHPFWVFDEVDLYLCNIAEQATKLEAMGVPKDKIAVTGLFLAEKFNKVIEKEEAITTAGLLSTMPKVLLFNGARPRMSNKQIFLQLLRSPKSFQIIVVCGNNLELKKELEKISAPSIHPVKILGYTNQVDILMTAADIMVGKTGGPTMGEAVLKKLPIILTDISPGHEEENLKYLLKNNIVDYARIPREVTFLVEQYLSGKKKMKSWGQAYRKIVLPDGSVSLIQALNRVKPVTTVTHYQEAAFKV